MSETIFHKIIAGKSPCAKVYEDEHIFVFMDVFPQSRGHTLIVPKKFAPDLLSIDPASLQHITLFSQKLAHALKTALQPEGIKVVQFNGEAAGQTVFYYHMHLIPVWKNAPLTAHGQGMADLAELQTLAGQIAAALAASDHD